MRDVTKPIRLIVHCPFCHRQHVDRGEWAVRVHHDHLCERCGLVWRPCLEPTVGVESLCEHEWAPRLWYDPQLGVRRGRYCLRCNQSHPDVGRDPVGPPPTSDPAASTRVMLAEIPDRNYRENPGGAPVPEKPVAADAERTA